jgi:hypothetical protein
MKVTIENVSVIYQKWNKKNDLYQFEQLKIEKALKKQGYI